MRSLTIALTLALVAFSARVGGGQAGLLSGRASWSPELLQEYVRKRYQVSIPARPAPFPNEAMLDELNPEFALRLRALKAFHQADGGTPNVGLVAGTGGLRSAQDQRRIYAICRRKRSVFVNGFLTPLDGSRKEHWEDIPESERTDQNCPRHADGTRGPATRAWVSWHQLGVAADFAVPTRSESSSSFGRTMQLAGDLGMIYGGWWGRVPGRWAGGDPEGCVVAPRGQTTRREGTGTWIPEQLGWDPGHVEWHPKLNDPERLAGQSGTALRADQVDAGYDWKIPGSVYLYQARPSEPGSLHVVELTVRNNWLCASRWRALQGDPATTWSGTWARFDPPLPLFPAYIPTDTLARTEGVYPEDLQHRTTVQVQLEGYSQSHDGVSIVQKHHLRQTGRVEYVPFLQVEDMLKVAGRLYATRSPDAQRYVNFRNLYAYTLHATQSALRIPVDTPMRTVDADGYTRDATVQVPCHAESVGVVMVWDRERGRVGLLQNPEEGALDLGPTQQHADGTVSTLSAGLPPGAWEQADPPAWTPANPRPDAGPSPTTSPTPPGSDFFRP
ncbi:MAG: hypothetical protein AB1758_09490 [Candidatus Eremiobacterota bacterium]